MIPSSPAKVTKKALGSMFNKLLGYSLKPYGNIPDAPIIKANLNGIQWELEFVPDDTSAKAKVYAAGRLDKTAGEEFAKSFHLFACL